MFSPLPAPTSAAALRLGGPPRELAGVWGGRVRGWASEEDWPQGALGGSRCGPGGLPGATRRPKLSEASARGQRGVSAAQPAPGDAPLPCDSELGDEALMRTGVWLIGGVSQTL